MCGAEAPRYARLNATEIVVTSGSAKRSNRSPSATRSSFTARGSVPAGVSASTAFFFVPVISRAVLARARPCEPAWSALTASLGQHANYIDAAYVYTRGGDGKDTSLRSRMFAPAGGIPEDPATGSATALLARQLLIAEKLRDGKHRFILEQGYEMKRPSDLVLEADVAQDDLEEVRVGGQAVRVMAGVVTV